MIKKLFKNHSSSTQDTALVDTRWMAGTSVNQYSLVDTYLERTVATGGHYRC